jgi:SNF2 family DNA or RNA helicase
MYEFQDAGVAFLRSHPRCLLGDEAGLGKSRQLLLAAEGETLVVAPAMVLDGGVWDAEVARWRPDLPVTTTSYHGLRAMDGRKVTKELKPAYRRHWDTVIFDEAQMLKGRKTTWTQAAETLCKQADRVFLASGTPIPNWAHEMFVALKLLHPGDRRFTSYWRWIQTWFVVGRSRFSDYEVSGDLLECQDRYGLPRADCAARPPSDPCEHWLRFHAENFEDLFLQRLRDDVLTDLPAMTRQTVLCPMGAAQKKAYAQLKRAYMVTVEETGNEHYAWSDAAKYVKLAQCATGLPVLDPAATTGSGKLDVLAELLPGRSHPVLLGVFYRDTARAVLRLCAKLGLRAEGLGSSATKTQRRAVVGRFQAGELDVLVGSIEVVAEGLTLTRADTTVMVERHPVPSRNEQFSRRVHRIGQERPVNHIELVTPGTVDEGLLELLAGKTDNQARALSPAQLIGVI